MRHLILITLLLTGITVFAAPKKKNDRPATAPLPKTPTPTSSAIQLTGNETPDQLLALYSDAIKSLLPGIASTDNSSLLKLEATVHNAARPGAEAERLACCNAIVAILNTAQTAVRVKSHLVHQLQLIGKTESVPTLVTLLTDADPHLASDARIALLNNPACPEQNRNILPALATSPRQAKFTALRASLLAAGDAAAPKMLDLLAGDDADARTVALGFIKELNADARKKLVAGCGKLPAVTQSVVIEQLANLDDKSVLPLALAGLKSADPLLQAAGLTALGRLDDAETDAAVLAAMNDATGEAKINLIGVVARRGKRTAVPALLDLTGNTDPLVAKAAYRALGELTTAEDAPLLLDKYAARKDSDTEFAASKALGKVVPPDRGAELVQAVFTRSTDAPTRASVLKMFRFCSGPKALAALQAAQADKDAPVREAAVRTLADWPDADAMDALVTIYQKPEKPAFGVIALRGFVRLAQEANKQPGSALVARYRQLLSDARNDDDRRRVLGALGGCDSVAGLELAVAQLATPTLRAESELAVKNIAELVKKHHPKEAKAALAQLK